MNNMESNMIRRGDIFYVDFDQCIGSTVHGIRPAMVIQNDLGNLHSPTVIVAAITSEIKKLYQPTHIFIGKRYGLTEESMLMLEQIRTMDKQELGEYIGSADEAFHKKLNRALAISVGIIALGNTKYRIGVMNNG